MTTNEKLTNLSNKLNTNQPIKIAIAGLGSVGNYLLNYLLDLDYGIELHIIGRSQEKMQCDLNIAQVAAGIRKRPFTFCFIHEADLNNISQLADVIGKINPDFIVNSSRAYSNLKYGSISWNTVRAYGIWSPLSVKYIKNIMQAVQDSGTNPIVINTSYSDAVNAWIKTAGKLYPDFGSGNLNHLIPRIRFAVAKECRIKDVDNIEITLAVSHFHDVVISKEGQTEGVTPLIAIRYNNENVQVDLSKIFASCAIPMPVDAKRNMMNASSNFEIISTILRAISTQTKQTLHIPGAMGLIGGYPVNINGSDVTINEDYFTLSQMQELNRKSIYLDGIENVENGMLFYTDELIEKTKKHFGYILPKQVNIDQSNDVATEIITNIIEKRL
ncbi:MAG: hypothetical protein LBQ31_11175 [Bacteroidales bacterium]|jgi:hypothetical protein|nr:hypothetical protein [Bacteroidales bacterium]